MRRRTLAIGAVLLGGAALLLFCCAGRDERGAVAPTAARDVPAEARSATPPAAGASPTEGGTTTPAATAADTASGAATNAPPTSASGGAAGSKPAGPGARIAGAVQTSDPRDLELLANIERELKRDPPNEVHAIIAARKRGASRTELASRIAALPDLGLRALTFRWLDTVTSDTDAGTR
jgi:hypothetical protein